MLVLTYGFWINVLEMYRVFFLFCIGASIIDVAWLLVNRNEKFLWLSILFDFHGLFVKSERDREESIVWVCVYVN